MIPASAAKKSMCIAKLKKLSSLDTKTYAKIFFEFFFFRSKIFARKSFAGKILLFYLGIFGLRLIQSHYAFYR